MKTLKDYLEDIYLGKKVKIILGHVDNDQHILGTVVGFEESKREGNLSMKEPFYILLEDISANTHWLDHAIKTGQFKRHYMRLSTLIEIV